MESGTKPTRYYLCSDTDTGILSAIYDAGLSCYGHRFIRILPLAPHACYEQTLFSEYVTVEETPDKADSVLRSIQEQLSPQIYQYVMCTLASTFPDRGDVLYQFITYAFHMGDRICFHGGSIQVRDHFLTQGFLGVQIAVPDGAVAGILFLQGSQMAFEAVIRLVDFTGHLYAGPLDWDGVDFRFFTVNFLLHKPFLLVQTVVGRSEPGVRDRPLQRPASLAGTSESPFPASRAGTLIFRARQIGQQKAPWKSENRKSCFLTSHGAW